MTDQNQRNLDTFEQHLAPWLNRILLGILAYFAIQIYETISDLSVQQNEIIRVQSVQQELIRQNQQSIIELYQEDARFRSNIENFYRDYGGALKEMKNYEGR